MILYIVLQAGTKALFGLMKTLVVIRPAGKQPTILENKLIEEFPVLLLDLNRFSKCG